MKTLALLALLLSSTSALANISTPSQEEIIRYQCRLYTDNKVEQGQATDNPQQEGDVLVIESDSGFLVMGDVLGLDQQLEKDPSGQYRRMGYNRQTVMTHEENTQGNPYFIFYFFKDQEMLGVQTDPRDNVNRLVVLGGCV